MKKTTLFMLIAALFIHFSSLTAQVQTGVFKTPSGNTDFHHFTRNHATGSAVFINQQAATGSILRLSSGIATADQNVKFAFEGNGRLGIGTTTPAEKLSLYTAGNTRVVTQYGNGTGSGFTVGMDTLGNGAIWHTATNKTITFGTSNKERMKITAAGTVDLLGTIQSVSGGYKIDTTGVFQSKGYRTIAANPNYHHFTNNHASNAAVFINQVSTTAPILRLSSGIFTAGSNVKFSFENNGNLGIGTITPAEKLSLYTAGSTKVVTQYGNGTGSGFTVGMNADGHGMLWHTATNKIITFGTKNKEQMRINADGTVQSYAYRTMPDNTEFHHFTRNKSDGPVVYINQVTTTGPILRLSSGTANANENVKFSFESNGNLGIGTTSPGAKLSLFTAGNSKVATQYGNGTGSGFTVGMDTLGNGAIWHTATTKTITFGTSNKERMKVTAAGTIDFLGTIQSVSGGYKIDTTGIFQSKGYRTIAANANYHHFTSNHTSNAAVFINQVSTTAPILRLSSGIATYNQNIKFSFENNGNLGIGTTTPAEKLSLYTAGNTKVVTQYGNGTGSGFSVGMNTDGNGIIWHTTSNKTITFGTNNTEQMRINANGNVGIGTASPYYKLDVAGIVRAREVVINLNTGADFVFDEDYQLRPLSEVERFITANKHLPEIASESEMIENGVGMAEMQIKLLQKVEELTLYVIQQQKEIEELKRELRDKN